MAFSRRSGLLLHPTSLPGAHGLGEIGTAARAFVDTLAGAGQSIWQFLPLGPTGYGDSPYQSLSTFAANPLLVSFDDLLEEGLLTADDLADAPAFPDDRVDFGSVIAWRRRVLAGAAAAFAGRAPARLREACDRFCAAEAHWLDDFALFVALKDAHDGRSWAEWDQDLARRVPEALEAARRRHAAAIHAVRVVQFLFARQWAALRRHARRRGVMLVGDLPIFVAGDSADVWANPGLFHLDDAGRPTVVAGVPPDYFSATGQLWGNPLYRWDVHARDGYAWWIARMRRAAALADLVRLDHFRGFEMYWEIPGDAPTAATGRWVEGPGAALFEALRAALGGLPLIAEDLGFITPAVHALRRRFHLPGMWVLQFAMHRLAETPPRPPEECAANTVVYTGTHDNDTTAGWFAAPAGAGTQDAAEELARQRAALLAWTGTDGREIHWDLTRLAWRSRARMAIAPVQDVLGLGSEARMNLPGRPWGNWQWRMRADALTPDLAARLRDLTERHGRLRPGG